ncbi:glycosyltransferase family 4 protein [Simiduia agarivorans]|uniref:Group 1 glycosyl transferase n=1 Tax=Simiduia agarivorans (strain DSM 21679 / JCM 13881 / BCRC 17597 / SA1) TaxID=1117647 RepID=K4L0Q2_SIMAS|nr:glycosyltransferase family 4 protein [Simiduia agarivorans]AFU99717.2 group 1 glycosyl transferase [Simiduia agarivorans SA1 = DSM 21679]
MKKLTVIQVLPELHGGGVERGTLEIAAGLVAAGHRSVVISAGGRLVPELEAAGSEHITLPIAKKSLWALRQVRVLRKLFVALQADIIHLRSRLPAWLCYLAWRKLPAHKRPRLVTTVHGLYSVNRYSKIMARGEAVIAVSETIVDYIRTNYPDCFGPQVRRIYRGIDPAQFPRDYQPSAEWSAQWQQQFPQLVGKKVLCLPGRITRLKGHLDFLDMLHALVRAGEPVAGLIVGGEDPRRMGYYQEIKARVEELQLEDLVVFTGHRRDIRDIYAVSDLIFSLSTKPESFGRTVLEPLAMGRMVVGYDHGGVGEILAALFPQGRVPLQNADALRATALQLLKEPQLPAENQQFLLKDMVGQTLALYGELAS